MSNGNKIVHTKTSKQNGTKVVLLYVAEFQCNMFRTRPLNAAEHTSLSMSIAWNLPISCGWHGVSAQGEAKDSCGVPKNESKLQHISMCTWWYNLCSPLTMYMIWMSSAILYNWESGEQYSVSHAAYIFTTLHAKVLMLLPYPRGRSVESNNRFELYCGQQKCIMDYATTDTLTSAWSAWIKINIFFLTPAVQSSWYCYAIQLPYKSCAKAV